MMISTGSPRIDMSDIRKIADETEKLLPEDILPYPNYEQLLFSVY